MREAADDVHPAHPASNHEGIARVLGRIDHLETSNSEDNSRPPLVVTYFAAVSYGNALMEGGPFAILLLFLRLLIPTVS